MTSLSAVVSITVVLLGGPQGLGPFTMEGPYAGRLAAPGPGFPLQGDKIMHESAAGLTTIVGPDYATLKALFEDGVRSEADVQKATVEVDPTSWHWQARDFEFLWPQDRPQYYLEQVEPDLYRRIELVDKEGYTVSVQPTGRPDELTVQVEFANKTLSGGKYDETIRAFVGRPTLIKAVVTATAPLIKGQKTLLVWQPPPPPRITGPGGMLPGMPRPRMMPGGIPMAPGGMPSGMAGLGMMPGVGVGPMGEVIIGAPQGVPIWAVGDWELTIPEEDESITMTVHPDGSISITGAPGSGTVEPSGQVRFRAEGEDAVLTGTLSPSGTGSGRIRDGDRETTWTATKVRLLQAAQVAGFAPDIPAQSAPTLRVLDGRALPTGVAVLLEVKSLE